MNEKPIMKKTDTPMGLDIQGYKEFLYKIAFSDAFLTRVARVYNLIGKQEALSLIVSNDLESIIDYIALKYHTTYGKKYGKKLITKEQIKKDKNAQHVRDYRDYVKKHDTDKYKANVIKNREYSRRHRYKDMGIDKIIFPLRKKFEILGLKIDEYHDFSPTTITKICSVEEKIEKIIVIRRGK